MSMRKLALVFTLCLSTSAAIADLIYVAPVEGIGIEQEKLEALRELFKGHVNASSDSTTDVPQGSDFTLKSKLIKVSGFNLTMTKFKGPEKIKSTSWRAPDFAALETVSQKAVMKTLGGIKSMLQPEKDLSQKVEERKKSNDTNDKVYAPRQVRLGFGPAVFNNFNASSTGISVHGGYYWNINNDVDLGVHADFAISPDQADVTLFSTRIMGNYFPIVFGETSPYVGAGFGYGFASTHDPGTSEKVNGFAGSLQAGAKFFRTSNVNLGAGLEWNFIMKSTPSYGVPSRFLFHIDLYF